MLKRFLNTLLLLWLATHIYGQEGRVRILKSELNIALGPYIHAASDGGPNWIGGRYSFQVGHHLGKGYMLGAALRWDRPWSETDQSEAFFPHRQGARIFLRRYFQSIEKVSIFNELDFGSNVSEIRTTASNPSVREMTSEIFLDARIGLQWRFSNLLSLEANGGIRLRTETGPDPGPFSYQMLPIGRIGINAHLQREWGRKKRKRKK